jgi:predicted enzyme related to lactoylglutathione lyase
MRQLRRTLSRARVAAREEARGARGDESALSTIKVWNWSSVKGNHRSRPPWMKASAGRLSMTGAPARFTWYELMTHDAQAAGDFYRHVIGWSQAPSAPGSPYTIFSAGGLGVAGMMEIPDSERAAGAKPIWVGYVLVDDVDAYVDRVVKAGGAVHRAPTDVPGVLRFSLVNDPQGALFVLFKPVDGSMRTVPPRGAPGTVGWHELMAVEGPTAFEFYSGLFGWTRTTVHDMGPMGHYQLFSAGADGDFGGIMTKPAVIPAPYWNFYWTVEGVQAAARRIEEAGGAVINGPHQVPGGAWIVQGRDPQEAVFALTSATE